MTWLAWRQFRIQAAVAFGPLAVLAAVLIPTGLRLRTLYDNSGLSTCNSVDGCDSVASAFLSHYSFLQTLLKLLVLVLPPVVAIFWGAPMLGRELETGTYRLAWTQSVTRARWFTCKLAVLGTATIAFCGLLSLIVTWWYSPIDRVTGGRFDNFEARDIAPVGYAAFGFALGLLLGLLIRRTLPAMTATLVGYVAVRVAVGVWVRPHFRAPLSVTGPFEPIPKSVAQVQRAAPQPNGWIISQLIHDPQGHVVSSLRFTPSDPCAATQSCLNGYTQTLTYQPGARYWPFQWYETGLFIGIAIICVAICYWLLASGRRAANTAGNTAAKTAATDAIPTGGLVIGRSISHS
jgi:ABC-type transport system involved in multi-copper enzyme maturation permease subunit